MALHNLRGKEGEQLAIAYLREREFNILHCNWKFMRYEIDIIAAKDGIIHFIEVKTRHTTTFGYPEQSVSKKKFSNLKKAAVEYLFTHPVWIRVQYDILAITRLKNTEDEYFFIEDVYL